jgi:eukaryotic translation initiation factor 2C
LNAGKSSYYDKVKQASDSFIGVPSQCISSPKASIGNGQKPDDQFLANLAMKINAKLAGVNWIVDTSSQLAWQKEPYMVLGDKLPAVPFHSWHS